MALLALFGLGRTPLLRREVSCLCGDLMEHAAEGSRLPIFVVESTMCVHGFHPSLC